MTRQLAVLECIDAIDNASYESEMNVLASMNDSYYKASLVLENYEGEELNTFELFSESYYMEAASNGKSKNDKEKSEEGTFFRRVNEKTGKKENILISILFAIPRIVIRLGEMLIGLFKKDKSKQSPTAVEKAEEKTNALSEQFFKMIDYLSPNLRNDCQALVNKEIKKYGLGTKIAFYTLTGVQIGLDVICVGVRIVNIQKVIIGFINRIRKIYERFTDDLNLGNPDGAIRKCAKEIKDVLNKDKELSLTTAEYTGKAFLVLYDQVRDICKTMSDATKVLGKTLSAVLKKCKETSDDTKTLETATELVNKCNQINNDILHKAKIVKTVRDYTGMCMSLIGLVYPIEYLNEGLLTDTDTFIAKINTADKSLIKEFDKKARQEIQDAYNISAEELERINMKTSAQMMSDHWFNCINEMLVWKRKNPRKSGEGDMEYCSRFYRHFIKEKKVKDLIDTIKSGFHDDDSLAVRIDPNDPNMKLTDVRYHTNKLYKDNLIYAGKKKAGDVIVDNTDKIIQAIDDRSRRYTDRVLSGDK